MRHQQTKYIVGYTVLVVEGKGIESVLQACIDQGYSVWDVMKEDKLIYRITIFRKHATYITNLIEYHGMTILKVKHKGGLQFLQYVKQKKAVFISLFICTILLFLLMNTAWKIQINGVSTHLEDKIKTQLEDKGLYQGAWVRQLPPLETLQEEILHELPELLYVGIRRQGVFYHIEAIEKKIENPLQTKNAKQLVAKKSGIIEKMFISSGQSLVERNDFVKKGDILVSNEIEVEESEENEKKKTVPVRGNVYANTWYDVEVNASLESAQQKLTGEQTKSYRLQFKNQTFPIWGFGQPKFKQNMIHEDSKALQLWKWRLPIKIVEETRYEYKGDAHQYQVEEAKEKALKHAEKVLRTKIGQDMEVLEYYVLHEREENGKVKMNIYFSVLEDIAMLK